MFSYIFLFISIGFFLIKPSFATSTVTGNMNVSVTVVASCAVIVPPLAFGNYTGVNLTAQAEIAVSCTSGVNYKVALNPGNNNVTNNRFMKSTTTTDTLAYALYSDSTRQSKWGDTPGVNIIAKTSSGIVDKLMVYGSIGEGLLPPAGLYTDIVAVTVEY